MATPPSTKSNVFVDLQFDLSSWSMMSPWGQVITWLVETGDVIQDLLAMTERTDSRMPRSLVD